jgi:uncharacterized membrane protein YraQ (UPF0718 family)
MDLTCFAPRASVILVFVTPQKVIFKYSTMKFVSVLIASLVYTANLALAEEKECEGG